MTWHKRRSVRREMEFVRMKSDFVSNVSHDLRTPLALIRMYAETLEMGRLAGEEKKHEYCVTIVKETERLTRLVNNLLNFSRMEAGRRPYSLSPLDLNALVRNVLDSFSPHLGNEGFSPVVDLDRAIPRVRADTEAVQEALINLLGNAIKFTERGSIRLRVTLDQRGANKLWLSARIEDTGSGISDDEQKNLFQPAVGLSPSSSSLRKSNFRSLMTSSGGKCSA